MIPSYSSLMKLSLSDIPILTSDDYKLNYSNLKNNENYINGSVSDLSAIQQVIYKILNTNRYSYPIYSWNYGVELVDLFGMPIEFVCAELERRISEALTHDERIISVSDFVFDTSSIKKIVLVSFFVETIFGKVSHSTEVII